MAESDDEIDLMTPGELRAEVSELRTRLKNVRAALNTLIASIEANYGDGDEEALDGALDADLIHEDLRVLRALLGPDPNAAEEPSAPDTAGEA